MQVGHEPRRFGDGLSQRGIVARDGELDEPPAPRLTVGKVIGWAIPLAIVAFFVYLAATGRFAELRDQAVDFILITGTFAAIGAALALGHPLAILVAFVAAPIGVLHPLLATGWFSGLAQAWIRKPTVADFEYRRKWYGRSGISGSWRWTTSKLPSESAFFTAGDVEKLVYCPSSTVESAGARLHTVAMDLLHNAAVMIVRIELPVGGRNLPLAGLKVSSSLLRRANPGRALS